MGGREGAAEQCRYRDTGIGKELKTKLCYSCYRCRLTRAVGSGKRGAAKALQPSRGLNPGAGDSQRSRLRACCAVMLFNRKAAFSPPSSCSFQDAGKHGP